MTGLLLACLTYFPLFKALTHFANPALDAARSRAPVVVVADPKECSFQFNPIGTAKFTTSCDVAKNFLASASVPYTNEDAPAGSPTVVKISASTIESFPSTNLSSEERKVRERAFTDRLRASIKELGYPSKANPDDINYPMVLLVLVALVGLVALVYAPIAAVLVELYPTRIRYTGMSLPYHVGNGWFGGFLPTTAFALVAATGNTYSGLWYPVIIAGSSFVIGVLFLPETKDRSLVD